MLAEILRQIYDNDLQEEVLSTLLNDLYQENKQLKSDNAEFRATIKCVKKISKNNAILNLCEL